MIVKQFTPENTTTLPMEDIGMLADYLQNITSVPIHIMALFPGVTLIIEYEDDYYARSIDVVEFSPKMHRVTYPLSQRAIAEQDFLNRIKHFERGQS